jgi:sugar phosphate isomerase/epimerase
MDIGVMFWAGRDRLAEIRSLGVSCGQLGIGGEALLTPEFLEEWREASRSFRLVTAVCAFTGESYDLSAVKSTVGFTPVSTRAEREARACQISDFAAALGIPGIACHIGHFPDDRTDPDYLGVRDAARRICDHAAAHGQTFALETGLEPAESVLRFLEDAGRGNLKINFDPANMILYGSGDPVAAFEKLAPHVVSIHAKDGDPPPRAFPGRLGEERPLGEGSVGIARFIEGVWRSGYDGVICVEREIEDQRQRIADLGSAVGLLRRLVGG